MSREKSSYTLLIEKLDQFIRKYYLNQIIKGSLYSVGLIALSVLLFAIAENFFYFGTSVRKVLFFSFLLITVGALVFWVGIPLLHYFRLGKLISHEQAAEIIGDHFSDVRDKLINILQLNKQSSDDASNALIRASIDQKTREIQPVAFQSAIDLSKNRKYLPYALPPLLILLGILVGAPSLIKDPATRILKNNVEFERAAPFSFIIGNQDLSVPQFEDFRLMVQVEGDYLPEQAFVMVNGFQYRLKKDGPSTFSYVFNNVQDNQAFSFQAEGVQSKSYELNVLKKPSILDFTTQLDYPAYIGRQDETLNNVGDMVVPAGTKIDWVLQSVNTSELQYQWAEDTLLDAQRLGEDAYTFNRRVYSNSIYKILLGNEALPQSDSVSYAISVIPDLYPSISMKQFADSSEQKLVYLVGEASDDYGLRRITFNYSIINKGRLVGEPIIIDMVEPDAKQISFDHVFDLAKLNLKPGDEVHYYFEAWDNDGVQGSKSSRTSLLKFEKPTEEEYARKEDANEEDIKKTLEEARKESESIKKSFQSLREKMLQEKSVDWQLKKELEDLLDRQNNLEEELENAREKFNENLENQQEFTTPDEQTLEKQEKLQELFEKLADDETKELMEKIQQLMEELNKDEALQMMEDMEMSEEQLSMELDRLKELFKQLEMERDLKQEIEKLNKLAEEQEKLSEQTEREAESENQEGEKAEAETDREEEQGSEESQESKENQSGEQTEENSSEDTPQEQKNSEEDTDNATNQEDGEPKEVEEEQEDINKAFEDIQKELEQLRERNEEMQSPQNMEGQEEQMEDIQQDLDQIMQQLQQNQKQNASKSQKNAGQKMRQAAQKMQEQMQSGEMQQMAEDMQAMRQLLENLISMSFDQEDMISEFSKTNTSTPQYKSLVQRQYKLKDDFHLIEDSLQALSQRVYQIESFVLDKVTEINRHMDKSLDLLEDRKKAQASDNQQRTMKNVNDLALMFSESMNQMQQQMASMMSGSQMCTKPGSGNPKDGKGNVPMDKISQGQQKLNEDMQRMRQGMQEGGSEGTSKEFAQMAAKQAALRKALRDIQREKQSQGQGSKELEEILEQMDKIETDLVNKKLTNEMMKRQEDILTRLLESEKAEREQEYENERESRTAETQERTLPPEVEKYIRERESQIEPFKTVSPALKPYYKQLVEEYYKSLKGN